MKLNRMLAGLVAGTLATGPMTLTMIALHRALPRREQYPLPPRQILRRFAERLGWRQAVHHRREQTAATLAAHFAYGGAAGAVYGALADHVPLPKPLSGLIFALIVWFGSYMAWLPVTGLYPSADDESAGRNRVMIAAHVVWGVTLGGLLQLTSEREALAERFEPQEQAPLVLVRSA